jgi:hypothetical protein
VLAVTAVLGGMPAATYVRTSGGKDVSGTSAGGGLLAVLAIGCPACNKLVVLALGTTGAPTVWALRATLATERSCPVPQRDGPDD